MRTANRRPYHKLQTTNALYCETSPPPSLPAIHATPPDAEHPPFNIDSIKDRWNHPTSEGWSDIRINGHMQVCWVFGYPLSSCASIRALPKLR